MKTIQDKIDKLVEDLGYDSIDELLEDVGYDSIVPGICLNSACDATYDVEPDATDSYCEECGCDSVESILVLLGVI